MSDSDREFDECDFSDEVFDNQIRRVQNQGKQQQAVVSTGMTTMINSATMARAYKDNGCGTSGEQAEASTMTKKATGTTQTKRADDAESSDEQAAAPKNPDDFEIVGLEKWLKGIYPKIAKILERNSTGNIFDSYQVAWEEDEIDKCELLYKLQNQYNFGDANSHTDKVLQKLKDALINEGEDDFDDDFGEYNESKAVPKNSNVEQKNTENMFQVTSISWSCNGAMLAVAYGKTDHVSWCEHQSIISVWRIFTRDLDTSKPNNTIETDNCLTNIEFHPTNPLILAGGTVNGQIFIWNLDKKDKEAEQCSSLADEYFHREPIQKIIWMGYETQYNTELQYYLVTISMDAKILYWKNPEKSLAYPSKGQILARQKNNVVSLMAGLSMALVPGNTMLNDNTFIIGTEVGAVQRCIIKQPEEKDIRHYLNQHQSVTWSNEAIHFLGNCYHQRNTQKIKDLVDQYMLAKPYPRNVYVNHIFSAKVPIQHIYRPFTSSTCTNFDPHFGPVTGISISPFNKRLFLTCSTDGSVRLYDFQEKKAVASFEPSFGEYINCVQWSPFRPAVFACVSNAGSLYVYDLVQSKAKVIEMIKHDDMSISPKYRQAQEICFNPRQRNYIAVGYHDKIVRVFKLSRTISNPTKDDAKVLKSFLEDKVDNLKNNQ